MLADQALPPGPTPWINVVVAAKVNIAEGVYQFTLSRADGAPLPDWTPGAHIDVRCGNGGVNPYSLHSDPGDTRHYNISVRREPDGRGGSAWLHDQLAAGAPLMIGQPRNTFAMEPAARYLFLAGGIGVTPLLSMAREAVRRGQNWAFHYGGRSRAAMAHTAELLALAPSRVHFVPQDEAGLPDIKALCANVESTGTLVYACGPEPMLRAAERAAGARCRVERFAVSPITTPPDAPFQIVLAASSRTLPVPAGMSILDILHAAGIDAPYSCRGGLCGACETQVLDGEPLHLCQVLTDAERASGRTMMICVSRARSASLTLAI